MKIEIVDMDHMGNGIGRVNNKVKFVPKSITGDICEVVDYKSYKKYDVSKIENVLENSSKRIDALCPYYNECGGCNISNLEYIEQLKFKVNKVKNIFKKYLDMDINPRVIGSEKEYHYRNKVTYHVSDGKIGLVSQYDGIVSVRNCLLVSEAVNKLYEKIRKEDLSMVDKVIIKECDNGLILIIYGNIDIDKFKDFCIAIYVNDICKYQKEIGYISIGDIKYLVSDKSFFQINTSNIINLYDEIVRYGKFTKSDRVIDLYCGVGSISLYISKYVDSVFGIEIIPDAIIDAKKNARINNINNAEFLCEDVSKVDFNDMNCDVLIVDPPRIGLDRHTVDIINNKGIDKIIYVSCDPMTLVRDLKLFNNYKIENISLVDMFPQTHHVESVVLLNRK